jgi:cytochrome P450
MPADRRYEPGRVASLPDGAGLIRFLRSMVANPVASIPAAAYREGVVIPSFARKTLAFISDPALLEEILIRRVEDFPKSLVDERLLRPAFGDGLLLADGESWRWKRRLASPFFTPAALAGLVPNLAAPFQALVQTWRRLDGSRPVDVVPALTTATLRAIDGVLFSGGRRIDAEAVSQAINDYLEPISWVVGFASLNIPSWVPFPGRRQIARGKNRMRALVHGLVAERRRSGVQAHDLCGQLMHARDPETDRPLGDEDSVDMLLTLIAAGHETTANGLCWAIWCLAGAPELQASLANEIEDVVGSGPIEPELWPRLTRTKALLLETLRLFPPAPLLARRTVKPETLGGHDLPVGMTLFIPIYAIHRHERLWPDPHRFDLCRFQDGRDREIARTAYLPFGAGPKICIGASLAMTEMTVALATLLQAVRFRMVEGYVADPIHRITLRPRGGLPVWIDGAAPAGRAGDRISARAL